MLYSTVVSLGAHGMSIEHNIAWKRPPKHAACVMWHESVRMRFAARARLRVLAACFLCVSKFMRCLTSDRVELALLARLGDDGQQAPNAMRFTRRRRACRVSRLLSEWLTCTHSSEITIRISLWHPVFGCEREHACSLMI